MNKVAKDEAILIRVDVNESKMGLFEATSLNMPNLLFVADRNLSGLMSEIPKVIQLLLKAEHGLDFMVMRARDPMDNDPRNRVWVAIPM